MSVYNMAFGASVRLDRYFKKTVPLLGVAEVELNFGVAVTADISTGIDFRPPAGGLWGQEMWIQGAYTMLHVCGIYLSLLIFLA